jgi:light-regulated signal transduction histidine kinase (bacteriophytochrome)
MIDDLLTYSRAGRLEPTLGTVDVTAVVGQTYLKLATQYPAARLGVGALPQVTGSPSLLGTVLTCLVRNALLFNTSADPTVQIQGYVEDEVAVITVTDNGIGMTAAHCDSVFDLFRRLHTREEYAGTGTGLTLCRRLMTLQHGTITLDSTLGAGTTVTLTLPACGPSPQPTSVLENGEEP